MVVLQYTFGRKYKPSKEVVKLTSYNVGVLHPVELSIITTVS
jgi:hypothetical protein